MMDNLVLGSRGIKGRIGMLLCKMGFHAWKKEIKHWVLDYRGDKQQEFDVILVKKCKRCPCLLAYSIETNTKRILHHVD